MLSPHWRKIISACLNSSLGQQKSLFLGGNSTLDRNWWISKMKGREAGDSISIRVSFGFWKIINKRGLYIGDRRCWRPSNCFFFVFLTSGPGVHYTHPRGKIISWPFWRRRRRRRNEIEFRASPASLYLRHCVSSKNCRGDVWRARRRKSVKLNRVPRQHTPAHIQQQQQQQHRLVALHPGNERHRYIERGVGGGGTVVMRQQTEWVSSSI
jgi:hypothetical protein